MKDCTKFTFSAWRDGGENRCSLEIDLPELARIADGPFRDVAGGLTHVWFFFSEEELTDLAKGRRGAFEDGYHKLSVFDDLLTFYDLEMPPGRHGRWSVPYYVMNLPRFVQRLLLRRAKQIWREWARTETKDDRRERTRITISLATRQRWDRLYGRGKGAVKFDLASEDTEKLLAASRGSGHFDEMLERLGALARNSTWAYFQTARVKLSKDWDGFFFVIVRPNGRTTMHGGVVNHGRDGAADWSIHT